MPGNSDTEVVREVLTVGEVADYLGVCERVVYDQIHSGELPAADLGSQYRILREHLLAVCSGRSARKLVEREPRVVQRYESALDTDEVAELLRLSPDTVRRKAGEVISAVKFGGQWRFAPTAIEELFEIQSSDLGLPAISTPVRG